MHDLNDRSWESEVQNSSQADIHNLNALIEANALLTKQVSNMGNEINMLREEAKTKDEQLKEHIKEIANLKAQLCEKHPSTSNTKISAQVSRLLRELYPKLNPEERFNILEPHASAYNIGVRTNILSVLKQELDASNQPMAESQLKTAIKSRYYNEKKSSMEEMAAGVQRRRLSRRHTKYKSRVRSASRYGIHIDLMNTLSPCDMSDEESVANGSPLRIKKPSWRSNEIDEKLIELDAKVKDMTKKTRRRRILGSPSRRLRSNLN